MADKKTSTTRERCPFRNVTIPLHDGEWFQVEAAASKLGCNLENFLGNAALRYAHEVLPILQQHAQQVRAAYPAALAALEQPTEADKITVRGLGMRLW